MDEADDADGVEELAEFLEAAREANGEVMYMDELDGFLTALLVSPQFLAPEKWWPYIWSTNGDPAQEPPFTHAEHAARIFSLVAALGTSIASALAAGEGEFRPAFTVDPDSGEVWWKTWMLGFRAGVALAPAAWLLITEGTDEEAKESLGLLIALMDSVSPDFGLDIPDREVLMEEAADLIGPCAEIIYAWGVKSGTRSPSLH